MLSPSTINIDLGENTVCSSMLNQYTLLLLTPLPPITPYRDIQCALHERAPRNRTTAFFLCFAYGCQRNWLLHNSVCFPSRSFGSAMVSLLLLACLFCVRGTDRETVSQLRRSAPTYICFSRRWRGTEMLEHARAGAGTAGGISRPD